MKDIAAHGEPWIGREMKQTNLTSLLAVAAALSVVLAGCTPTQNETEPNMSGSNGSASEQSTQQSERKGDEPVVAVALYPLKFVVEQVGGDRVVIEDLTSVSGHAHNLELSPAQVQQVADADLTVYLSQGFQPSVEEAIELSKSNSLDGWGGIAKDEVIPGDSHVWLAPLNLAGIGKQLAEKLGEVDPENAEYYHENAEELADELKKIDREYAEALADCEGTSLLATHESFGYMAQAYDLEQIGVAGIDPEVEPSPARLIELQKVVSDNNITTLFVEPLASDHQQDNLQETLQVEVLTLDTMEVQVDPDQDVFDVFRSNLQSLQQGLNCSQSE